MADLANSIPASTVHPLSGSSSPTGKGLAFTPVVNPKLRTRPRLDATPGAPELRGIVSRLAPLIRREHEVQRRIEMLELHHLLPDLRQDLERISQRMANRIDRWTRRLMEVKQPNAAVTAVKADAYVELVIAGWTGGTRELGERLALSVAHDGIRKGLDAECVKGADIGLFEQVEAVLGLRTREQCAWADLGDIEEGPAADACHDLSKDLRISGKALALIPARTTAGVAAKASAVLAMIGEKPNNIPEALTEHRQLAMAVLRDAAALGVVEVGINRDAELLSLIARHGEAVEASKAAVQAADDLHPRWLAEKPCRPRALYWSANDRALPACREPVTGKEGSWHYVYNGLDVDKMRDKPAMRVVEHRSPAPWNSDETVVRRELVPDDAGEARRLEIIGAYDAWQAEVDSLWETIGLKAAHETVDVADAIMDALDDQIRDYVPRTFPGLKAKARWIRARPSPEDYTTYLLADLAAMLPVPTLADQPLHFRKPDHRAVEAYRQWLHLEGNYLAAEMYPHGGRDAERFIPWNTAANNFHDDAFEPGRRPSDRAEMICQVLGIDWATAPLEVGRPEVACAARVA